MKTLFALFLYFPLVACAPAGSSGQAADWDSMKYTDYAALGGGFLPMGK